MSLLGHVSSPSWWRGLWPVDSRVPGRHSLQPCRGSGGPCPSPSSHRTRAVFPRGWGWGWVAPLHGRWCASPVLLPLPTGLCFCTLGSGLQASQTHAGELRSCCGHSRARPGLRICRGRGACSGNSALPSFLPLQPLRALLLLPGGHAPQLLHLHLRQVSGNDGGRRLWEGEGTPPPPGLRHTCSLPCPQQGPLKPRSHSPLLRLPARPAHCQALPRLL